MKHLRSWAPGDFFRMLFVSGRGTGKYHQGRVKGKQQREQGERWYGSEWSAYEVLWKEDGVWSVSQGYETANCWEMLTQEQVDEEVQRKNKRARSYCQRLEVEERCGGRAVVGWDLYGCHGDTALVMFVSLCTACSHGWFKAK